MSNTASASPETADVITIKPASGWIPLELSEVWRYRELLFFFIWRDIKVRYRQTIFGLAWAIIQPLLPTFIFSVFFGKLAHMPSEGAPYPLFVFAAMVPWQFFAYSVSESANSLVSNRNLITKIYFPRVLIPLSAVGTGFVDFLVGLGGIFAMMAIYHVAPTPSLLFIPVFVVLAAASAFGVGLWLAALNALYRDVRYTVPFLVQFWLFATPIVYSARIVPERWRAVYGLNPMTGVIEGFRWSILGVGQAPGTEIFSSAIAILVILVSGLYFFRRTESIIADVI